MFADLFRKRGFNMGTATSLDKILEFAIARETESNQFYKYMVTQVENPDIRKMCEDFAREELKHKAKLELEAMKRGEVVLNLNISDYTIDLSSKLLDYSIAKEQHSMDLYIHLAEISKDQEAQELFLSLAQEEAEHKQQFENEYNKLLKVK